MIAALYALATGNYALKALCCPVVDLKQDKAGFLIIHNSTAMEAGYESYEYLLLYTINIIYMQNQTPFMKNVTFTKQSGSPFITILHILH